MTKQPSKKRDNNYKKGRKKTGGRVAGTENVTTTECKAVLMRCFTDIGGYKRFLEWVQSTDERLDAFYKQMWMRLLPMNIRAEDGSNKIYKSLEEVRAAFAMHGIALESLEKLKKMRRMEEIEQRMIDVSPGRNNRH